MSQPQKAPINYANVYRFVALIASADEYFFHIKDDLLRIDARLFRERLEKQRTHPKQIEKLCSKREKELRQAQFQTQKFFDKFLEKFSDDGDATMIDGFIDEISTALINITHEGKIQSGATLTSAQAKTA